MLSVLEKKISAKIRKKSKIPMKNDTAGPILKYYIVGNVLTVYF